jgi:hypothetical protein
MNYTSFTADEEQSVQTASSLFTETTTEEQLSFLLIAILLDRNWMMHCRAFQISSCAHHLLFSSSFDVQLRSLSLSLSLSLSSLMASSPSAPKRSKSTAAMAN